MSPLAWMIVVASQVAVVAAQILMKRSMSRREHGGEKARGWIGLLAMGILAMTVWFLLWVGVMHQVDLSKLMPLEAISPLLIVLCAGVFLRERLSGRGWIGVALTCLGVLLVSAS